MMTETQTDNLGQKLQQAVLQAAVDEAVQKDSESSKHEVGKKKVMVSPLTGNKLPTGRQKGAVNKVTRTIREAVEKAAQDCHADGLAGWLIERAQGGIQDRQIFAQMVNKAMPLQVQANVDGGIKLELSWLSSRSIGTSTAQLPEQRTQVIDLQPETDGTYRIKDQETPPPGGGDAAGGQGAGQAGTAGQGAQGPQDA
jgi:hypothetical protein